MKGKFKAKLAMYAAGVMFGVSGSIITWALLGTDKWEQLMHPAFLQPMAEAIGTVDIPKTVDQQGQGYLECVSRCAADQTSCQKQCMDYCNCDTSGVCSECNPSTNGVNARE